LALAEVPTKVAIMINLGAAANTTLIMIATLVGTSASAKSLLGEIYLQQPTVMWLCTAFPLLQNSESVKIRPRNKARPASSA